MRSRSRTFPLWHNVFSTKHCQAIQMCCWSSCRFLKLKCHLNEWRSNNLAYCVECHLLMLVKLHVCWSHQMAWEGEQGKKRRKKTWSWGWRKHMSGSGISPRRSVDLSLNWLATAINLSKDFLIMSSKIIVYIIRKSLKEYSLNSHLILTALSGQNVIVHYIVNHWKPWWMERVDEIATTQTEALSIDKLIINSMSDLSVPYIHIVAVVWALKRSVANWEATGSSQMLSWVIPEKHSP